MSLSCDSLGSVCHSVCCRIQCENVAVGARDDESRRMGEGVVCAGAKGLQNRFVVRGAFDQRSKQSVLILTSLDSAHLSIIVTVGETSSVATVAAVKSALSERQLGLGWW
jgi:hypothetical protein